MNIDIRVDGIAKMLRKFNRTEPIYAKPWTDALTQAAGMVQGDMKHLAPHMTGALEASITTKMQARPVPMYAKVGALPMPRNKGYRYPGALHGGARYHYRSGSLSGQPTKGWLTKPLATLAGKLESLLSQAAGKIESRWGAE